jgi:hypothetical protein
MKKTRLAADYSINFTLLGLTSTSKEYKLAWYINNLLQINLKKQDDIIIQFLNDDKLIISNFLYLSENSLVRLVKNKSHQDDDSSSLYLIPELKNFDYFLQISDEAESFDLQEVISKLSKGGVIEFITRIDSEKLKSKENLIFD